MSLLAAELETANTGWTPPASVVGHDGEAISEREEFLVGPPPEIGTVLTAHSTLHRAKQPWPLFLRVLFSLAVCSGIALGAEWVLGIIMQPQQLPAALEIAAWAAGCLFGLIAFLLTAFRHAFNFTGEAGVAESIIKGSRTHPAKTKVTLFSDAAALRTGQTNHYHNGVYTGTYYHFIWTGHDGRTLLKLKGSFRSSKGTPKRTSPYWFARAAEAAWNRTRLSALNEELERQGYVEFPINKSEFVRVGRGFLEFGMKGEVSRITVEEITSVKLSGGNFHIATTDAKWFSRKGKYSFNYANMSNAQLFLMALESLCGYRFN